MPDAIMRLPLLGMNSNAAEGVTEINPTSVVNFAPIRQGGYQTRAVIGEANETGVDASAYTQVIGYDHQGYSSFVSGSNFRVVRVNKTPTTSTSAIPSGASGRGMAHVAQLGAYVRAQINTVADGAFFVEDANGAMASSGTNYVPTVTASPSGGTFNNGTYYRMLLLTYIATQQGKLYTDERMVFVGISGSAPAATGSITVNGIPASGTPRNTEVYLARDPVVLSGTDPWRAATGALHRPLEYVLQGQVDPGGSITFTEPQFGPTINIGGNGLPMLAELTNAITSAGSFSPTGLYSGRTYFSPNNLLKSAYRYTYYSVFDSTANTQYVATAASGFAADVDKYTPLTIGWTEVGSVNLYNVRTNWYALPAQSSKNVTAFTPTEDGLIIWCENECFMLRGDPSFAQQEDFNYESFNIRPYLRVGHDAGPPPGILGSDVFPIWNGEIYQVSGGQQQKVSDAVYDRLDPFSQVVGDPERACIMALTKGGRTFAFYPQQGFWSEAVQYTTNPVKLLLPSFDTTRFIRDGLPAIYSFVRPESQPGSLATASATWRLVMQDKHTRKMLKRVRVPRSVGGTISGLKLEVSVDGYGATGANTEPWTITPLVVADDYIFAMPLGLTGYQFTLKLSMSANAQATIEEEIIVEYVSRGRKR